MTSSGTLFLNVMDFSGTAVFAATGVLASTRKHMDLVGATALAIVTAIGGGTLRDLLMGQTPVFWIQQPIYIWVAIATAFLTFAFVLRVPSPRNFLQIPDAIGLALYTWIGCEKAHLLNLPDTAIVLMGIITGCAGGIIRDVLSAEVPFIFRKGELYAAAALPGALALVIAWHFGLGEVPSAALCIALVLSIRLAALKWRIHLPAYSEKI
ncbi:trimeric intracellular cation channel family protein [soil metagenome]